MAKNGAKGGGRMDVVASRSPVKPPKNGQWIRRDPSSGRFAAMKKAGGPFKGVKREH